MVHFEDQNPDPEQRPLKGWTNRTLPKNSARFRNIIHVTNHIMSHILHFYHLVALDYVKPVVFNGTAFVPLTRPFLAPRYHDAYYINTARVLAVAPLLPPAAVATLQTLPGWSVDPGDAINNYLTGQYLKALNIRRICHEIQAIFSGRAPHNSGWTPGGATSAVKQEHIDKARELLYKGKPGDVGYPGTPSAPAKGTVMDFVGDPLDFANGKAFTMMFDVVAAAHLYYEYFWIGNSWGNFLAYGWGEEASTPDNPIIFSDSLYGGILYPDGKHNDDCRASARGYVVGSEGGGGCINPVIHDYRDFNIMNIGESVQTGSKYVPYAGFKHPWAGVTNPDPEQLANPNGYSWLKAPRYKVVDDYLVFEVGPLSRMVVNKCYFAGVLHDTKGDGTGTPLYTATPKAGDRGPNISDGNGHPLESVYELIPGLTGGPNLSGVTYNGDSVLDRIAARALECRMMCDELVHFLNQIEGTLSAGGGWTTTGITDEKVVIKKNKLGKPVNQKGYGMTEASRGALSHWIVCFNGKIKRYQAVVPTTWNASPRDANGNPGPAEKSLIGAWVANPSEAIELPRITHSYDFCIACAVHVITPEGEVHKIDVPPLPG